MAKKKTENEFDPYREALIVETNTIWGPEYEHLDFRERDEIEQQLHADPQAAARLEYVRMHTGFSRQITVTDADLERLGVAS